MPATHRGYRELVDHNGPVQQAWARESRRWFAPFALLVCAFLLGLIWLVRSGGGSSSSSGGGSNDGGPAMGLPVPQDCSGEKWEGIRHLHKVVPGETCYAIAGEQAAALEELIELNPQADCDALVPGQLLCVPLKA